MNESDLRKALLHVLWIGGPPDCGKTTVADLLAERHGLRVYHMDRHELDHIRRADARLHPATFALRPHLDDPEDRALLDETWVLHAPAEMAERAMASWMDRMPLVVEDLLALPADRAIVAEGPGCFPEVVLPLLADPRQAIWLVPTEAFKRASYARRRKGDWRRELVSDPERATGTHIERDLLMADRYRRTARERGLRLIEVDGARSAREVAAEVEAHFAPLLRLRMT